MPRETTIDGLLERYDGLLLDAYGVLVTGGALIDGAVDLLKRLQRERRPYAIVTNDASRHPNDIVGAYQKLGLPLHDGDVFCSAGLIEDAIQKHDLSNKNFWVLGPEPIVRFVRDCGARVGSIHDDVAMPDAIVCSDEAGYDFLPTVERVISTLFRCVEQNHKVILLLPNPDRIYPRGNGEFGIAAGSIALIIDDALKRRFGDGAPQFIELGKPHPDLFQKAMRRFDSKKICMIGDQLETDIAGAKAAGLDAALMLGGVGTAKESEVESDYILRAL